MKTIEGQLTAANYKFGIVTSRFNSFITEAAVRMFKNLFADETDIHEWSVY